MIDDSKIISSQEMIQHVIDFSSINPESRELPSAWKKVVSNIGKNKNSNDEEYEISLGERIAGNSHEEKTSSQASITEEGSETIENPSDE